MVRRRHTGPKKLLLNTVLYIIRKKVDMWFTVPNCGYRGIEV